MGYLGFEHEKKQFLSKTDKSRKGSIDAGVRQLVNLINKNPDYYTTSSCSGRTMLIKVPEKGKKWDSEWIFSKHGKITVNEIKKNLRNPPQDAVWFKKEGMILHACCRTIESASALVNAALDSGFKRSGILNSRRKIMVEICDTERIDAPVSSQGKAMVDEKYLRFLAQEANRKQDRTKSKIKRFLSLAKMLNKISKNKK